MIPPIGESFWQKDSLITFILFELFLFRYLFQLQIWCTTLYNSNLRIRSFAKQMFFVTYFIGIWTCIVEMSDFFPHWPPFALRKMKFNFRYFLIFFKGYPRVTLSELVHFYVLRKLNNLFDKDIIIYFGYVKSWDLGITNSYLQWGMIKICITFI